MTIQPIFLQGMMRCGGTYWWNKFREHDTCLCLYEPLHEHLRRKTREKFEAEFAEKRHVRMRHEGLRKSYFDEYYFRPEGGVEGYRSRFSRNGYAMAVGDEDPELETYLSDILNTAFAAEKTPVCKFVRAPLRAAWLKARFGAKSIFYVRQPEAQFESMLYQGMMRWNIALIADNRAHPFFGDLATYVENSGLDFPRDLVQVKRKDLEIVRAVFFHLYALSILVNLKISDEVVDYELMNEPNYRDRTAERLKALTGLTLDTGDYQVRRELKLSGLKALPEPLEITRRCARSIGASRDDLSRWELSPETAAALELVI